MASLGVDSRNIDAYPRVSVIVPVYNGAKTVGRALVSVFAQTFTDHEVIVVDDGSTDDTLSVLAGYGDRIRIVKGANGGPSAARNAGVHESRGEYIAFLDDDDVWMPEKLARCVPVLDDDHACALVYTGAIRVDAGGRPIAGLAAQDADEIESPTMQDLLRQPWTVVPSQFVVRRDAFERCRGFNEQLRVGEDSFFLLCVREHGHFRRVSEVLMHKETRPLWPKALEREPQCDQFVETVRKRYGASANGLIEGFRRSRVKVLRHIGHTLISERRPEDARRCLARVIHYQPFSPRAYVRYARTFFTARGARADSRPDGSGI